MNKRFFLAWLVVFIVWMVGGVVIHGVILGQYYKELTQLFRNETDSSSLFPLMILAHVSLSGALVWIYARGIGSGGWLGQGLRFGTAIAFLTVIPTYTIYYVVQPTPGDLAVKQIVLDGALSLILGVTVAGMYRKRA